MSKSNLVLDCMGSICPIHLYGKRYRRNFFTNMLPSPDTDVSPRLKSFNSFAQLDCDAAI